MKIRVPLKRLRHTFAKRRLKALSATLPFPAKLELKKKPMSDKIKNSQRISEMQDVLDEQVTQLAETVKLVATLRREVEELKKSNAELKQLCSLGQ